jgi:DNA repair exonuclease SbcCD ATPase subunit
MFLGKLWRSVKAQLNKLGNFFSGVDPIAQMQLEYDQAVEQLKEGRVGLEQYRALVERVGRQVESSKQRATELAMHEKAYENNLVKIQRATKHLGQIREKIKKYDAELKMSRAEAEMAQLASSFNFDVTTDFGQIESVIQDKISLNKAKVRVATDLSGEEQIDFERERAMEKARAEMALREFEVEMGLVTPDTAGVPQAQKQMGPVREKQTEG